jgi:hypothetical protein
MTNLNRRKFFGVAGSGVVGAMIASTPRVAHAESFGDNHPIFEKLRQQVEASLRSVYRAKNDLDLSEFLSSFDDRIIYQDATLGISIPACRTLSRSLLVFSRQLLHQGDSRNSHIQLATRSLALSRSLSILRRVLPTPPTMP